MPELQLGTMNTNALGIPTLGEGAATTSTDTTTQVVLETPGVLTNVVSWFQSLFGGSSSTTPAAAVTGAPKPTSSGTVVPVLLLGAVVGGLFWYTTHGKKKRKTKPSYWKRKYKITGKRRRRR